ncbi:LacI family DNA-binding transcriptional regulator [Agromyces sp. NPDC057865]|uniref:LacI family DNA-binding transcriptional regulator n=1 Tax=Agromyces sp. NPDC057865 TaxID=3346267 RepID=UPI00366B6DC4
MQRFTNGSTEFQTHCLTGCIVVPLSSNCAVTFLDFSEDIHVGKVTVKDVAAAANVSPSTVSNYFNRPARLSDDTRDRIRRAIRDLGFVPNDAARRLRAGTNPVVGYIAFELMSAFTPGIANAIEREVAARGMHVLMANDTESTDRERSYIELFEMQRVSGLIIAPVGEIETDLLELKRRGTPSVLSARLATSDSLASSSADGILGGYLAVSHLLEIGCRRVAFVTTSPELRQMSDRLQGALRAMDEQRGATFEVIQVPERSVGAGAAVAADIAARAESARPDALFCANDLLAIGVIQHLAVHTDIRIPSDVAVIGYDDIEFAASTAVPLSSVRVSAESLGVAAVELLFEEMELVASARPGELPDTPSRHILFEPQLVSRASTLRGGATG